MLKKESMTFKFFHWWYEWGRAGEPGMEEGRWMGEELGDIRGLRSPVWRRHSSSSLVRLRRFFSLLSFSTFTCRLAFSSESCLIKKKPETTQLRFGHRRSLSHTHTHTVGWVEVYNPDNQHSVGTGFESALRMDSRLTWKQQYSCLFLSWGPHSAAVTLGVSPPGRHSFQPAQKHSTNGAQHYFSI